MRAVTLSLSALVIACGPVPRNQPTTHPQTGEEAGAEGTGDEPVGDPTDDSAAPHPDTGASVPTAGSRTPAGGGSAGGAPADMQALLASHNAMRAKHCAAPLAWSPRLAAVAQTWANSLSAHNCAFEHSPDNSYGENLAGGSPGYLDGSAVTAMWYEEVGQYRFPDGGFSMQTGHFTQLVWRGTTAVGCAQVTCAMNLWVCEYDPPGNVDGEYRDNVLPTSCR